MIGARDDERAGHSHDSSFQEKLDLVLYKLQFDTQRRKDLYEQLAILLRAGKILKEALEELYEVHSDDGAKPKRAIAVILQHCRDQVANGVKFSDALRPYISYDEFATLSAGERASDLLGAFADATRIAEAKGKMMSAIVGGMAYPVLLTLNLIVLLVVVEAKLVPALKMAADPSQWTGAATALYYMAWFVSNLGIPLLVLVVLGVGFFIYSLPRLTGPVRYYLDKMPGYSIYRVMNGAIFLINMSVQIKNNVRLIEALEKMADVASPYMYERIRATIAESNDGETLGSALQAAGHEFPDREAIRLIKALGNHKGFETSLADYANNWIDKAVRKVQASMRVFLTAALIGVGATMLCIVLGTQGIREAVEASYR